MTYRHWWLIAVFILGFTSAVTSAQRNPHFYQTSDQNTGISQQRAVTIAQQHFPGRLLSVQRMANSYRVKILSSKGIVHVVTIDANSGEVIASH